MPLKISTLFFVAAGLVMFGPSLVFGEDDAAALRAKRLNAQIEKIFNDLDLQAAGMAVSAGDIRAKINDIVRKVYEKTMEVKPRYRELEGFDESALVTNENGFLGLKYSYEVPSGRGQSFPFSFNLNVVPINYKRDMYKEGYFEYLLPMFDLKYIGIKVKHPLRRQFDIDLVLEEAAEELYDYQQNFMPLRLLIIPEQPSFKTGEPIRFKVVLANVSEYHMQVKGLDKDTLFFTLNKNFWGTKPGQFQGGSSDTVLKSREALVVDFVGDSYKRAQDVEVRAIYQLNVKGLRPTTKVNIKITEE